LKHVVVLSENKYDGIMNFDADLFQKGASSSMKEMLEREAGVSFEDVVNI
jgi:hypothetical protein